MEFFDFATKAFELAKKDGCTGAEAYAEETKSFGAMLKNGAVDSYDVSLAAGMNLRVEFDGKNGYAYTEKYEDVDKLVARAIDNARTIENADECPMRGKSEYQSVTKEYSKLMHMSEREKIDLAFEYNNKALAASDKIERVAQACVQTTTRHISIMNTLGLRAEQSLDLGYGYIFAVAKDGNDVKEGFELAFLDEAADSELVAKNAVESALSKCGAKSIEAGKYKILLKNGAMADLLGAFAPMFSSEQAQRDLSLFKDKEGEKVAADCINLVDDPFCKLLPRAFDDEGTPSQFTSIIENGVLKTLLYNLKTAKKAGRETTGNGVRESASAPVSVAPTNIYIKSGDTSYEALVKSLGDGLIITELGGLHAGLNAISGEFSLTAKGQLVKDGSIVRAVEQITVAGSFIELMKNVVAVGNDMKIGSMDSSLVGSPSLLIKEAMIAGK